VKIRAGIALTISMGLVVGPLTAQAGVGEEGTFLIAGATVVTVSGETLEDTDVLLRDGLIAGVGQDLRAPADATEIDGNGKFVYPGLTNSWTALGLTEIGSVTTMRMQSELGEFNPHMRALAAINTASEMLGVTRANGVTSVIVAPSGGLVSGQAALVHTDGWTWEDMEVNGSAGYVVNYPTSSARRSFRGPPSPAAQARALERAEKQLTDLKNELRLATQYDRARDGGLDDIDLVYESMRPLVSGEVPAIMVANGPDEITGAIELGNEFGLETVIYGGREAWRVMDLLVANDVPVILSAITSSPPPDTPYDAIYAQPGVLVERGIKVAFSTGGAANARNVPYNAALAVAYGLSHDDAIKALTLWPAQIWGVDDRIGAISEGMIGDLIVTDGDPLDVRTTVHEVFIKGRRVPFDDRHTRLYERQKRRPIGGGAASN